MKTSYLNLAIGAPRRLEFLRRDFAQWFVKNPHAPRDRVQSWRDVRFANFSNQCNLSQGFNGDGAARVPVWYVQDAGPQFRDERFVDDIESAHVSHRGWFADADCDETVRGIVSRLPHGRFIAGYLASDNNERVYFADVFDDERSAAHMADEHARIQAEKDKAYSERWQAAQDEHEEAESLETDIKELIPMRHHVRARRELKEAIDDLRNVRRTLAEDYADIAF